MKPLRKAVAVVITDDSKKTLFALRSKNKKTFPNTWSLPSFFVRGDESFEDTIKRVGKEKLGVKLGNSQLLREGEFERENYILHMHLFSVKLLEGVPQALSQSYDVTFEKAQIQLTKMEKFGACTTLYKDFLEIKDN